MGLPLTGPPFFRTADKFFLLQSDDIVIIQGGILRRFSERTPHKKYFHRRQPAYLATSGLTSANETLLTRRLISSNVHKTSH